MYNPNPNQWRYNQGRSETHHPIIIDSESDENDDETPQPGMAAYSSMFTLDHLINQQLPQCTRQSNLEYAITGPHHGPRPPTILPTYTTSLPIEQEKKIRSRLREERHAALCVLMDRELLTIQALAAQEVSSPSPIHPRTHQSSRKGNYLSTSNTY